MKLISPCCQAEVRIASEADDATWAISHWYECRACGQPCDPVEAEEME